MRKRIAWLFIVAAIVTGYNMPAAFAAQDSTSPQPRVTPPSNAAGPSAGYNAWNTDTLQDFFINAVQNHLEIGTRITMFSLVENEKATIENGVLTDSFLGSITKLEEVQDYTPLKLFVAYKFTPWVAVEVSRDQIEARTITHTVNGHSDGNFVLKGPIVMLYGRYPNESVATPYAGIGIAQFNASFDAETWWRLGYSSPEDWAMLGCPNVARWGKKRAIEVGGSDGFVLAVGSAFDFNDHFSADVCLRHISVDVDSSFYVYKHLESSVTIPMSNYGLGMGVKYMF